MRRSIQHAALAAALGFGLVSPLHSQEALVRVHCRAAGEGGFVAAEVADSTADLVKALRSKGGTLRLVDSPAEADLVVTVEARKVEETGQRVYSTSSSKSWGGGRNTTTTSREKTVKVVYAALSVGKFRQEMTGVDSLFWSAAASQLAGQIDKWIKSNRSQILDRRAASAGSL